jgi:1-acyl-sn-glycerol-3-phosphate acyltransferase
LISNHASHLDAVAIAASVPVNYWVHLYIAAAKDYFFTNPLFTFFSQHCLGAIPIDRKDKRGEAIMLITTLLTDLNRMWLILFPEGTRSRDGKIHDFKRGVSVFSEKTQTPILFLFIEGNSRLWPKGALFAKPGKLKVYVGPVKAPAPIDEIYADYKTWVTSIDPLAFDETENPNWNKKGTAIVEPMDMDAELNVEKNAGMDDGSEQDFEDRD